MDTEDITQEAREDVMIIFSFNGTMSPPVSLRNFLADMNVFVTGNTLTLTPSPTWCEDSDPACANSETKDLAWAVDDIGVDRNFKEMLEFSLEDTTDDEIDALEDVLLEVVSSL